MDPDRREVPDLFDANVFLGPIFLRHDDTPDDVPRLLAELDANGISRALVTHGLAKWQHPAVGNRLVIEQTKGEDRLVPCWVVMPSVTGSCHRSGSWSRNCWIRRAGGPSLHRHEPAHARAFRNRYLA